MKSFIILALFCSSLYAADTTNSVSTDKRLVEVIFAGDDKSPTADFHEVDYLWISEKNRGGDRDYYGWADHGGYSPDSETQRKAAECRMLLKTIDGPQQLPDSPNKIVTVRYVDGDSVIVKKFPIDAVPSEVHQCLTIMGFPDSAFTRLHFIEKQQPNNALQPTATAPSVSTNR